MLSLNPIIQLLSVKPATFPDKWFRKVGGAAEYAQTLKEALPLPMAWVIRVAEKTEPVGEGVEDVTVIFDVVIAIENVRTPETGKTDEMLLEYRKAVRKMLLGYQMTDDNASYIEPVKRGESHVVDYLNGELFWRDRYQVSATMENY